MPELAPGLYVSEYVPVGTVYEMDLMMILRTPSTPNRGIAINPATWALIHPEEQERIKDLLVHEDALRGLALIRLALMDHNDDARIDCESEEL
jgi:hypothetical protein